jgi:hypothetical protein
VITDDKLDKFLKHLDRLVSDLISHHDLPVHSSIDQFYYMQKIEELKLLKSRLDEEIKRMTLIREALGSAYEETFNRWRKDARWLNQRLRTLEKSIP